MAKPHVRLIRCCETVTATFKHERETKNKVRFAEQVEGEQAPVVGTLYVSKEDVKKLDNPETLTVTIAGK